MKLKKTTSVILLVALAISLLANVSLLLHTTFLKAEYSWLRDTYETEITGAYQNDGRLTAHLEHFDGRSKEYILDSAPPSMGIPVENFHSHKPVKTGNTSLINWVLRVFDTSPKPGPERIWHTKLKNRWLEAFVREHNATLSRLRSEKP